jgi:excisionase family DNA binding protein
MMVPMNAIERAPNRIPKGAIRLSESFELLYRRLTPEWETLEQLCDQYDEDPDFASAAHEDPYRLTFEAMSGAEVAFRDALVKGDLRTFIHNADSGVDLELLRTGWLRYGDEVGIHSDYTDAKTPGPDCALHGLPHPVFLLRTDFEGWLARWESRADTRSSAESALTIGGVENAPKTPLASWAFAVTEVIERTGLSKTSVYEAITQGKLHARKYGVRTLILETDLDVFLKNLPTAKAE